MDFSEDTHKAIAKLYARGPRETDPRLLSALLDLTQVPNQRGIKLGREFTQRVNKPGIDASYNSLIGAVDVSIRSDSYGRRVYVYVNREHAQEAVRYIRDLRNRL